MTKGARKPDRLVAMAIGAHPDDIEFMMAGTLLLLKEAGAEVHMWNLANGHCGTAVHSREEIICLRRQEARDSAALAGATIHEPLADDIALFYEKGLLARAAAVVRQVKPSVLLVPSPEDYMEDHQNASRLAVSAAFCRGMKNFETNPPTEAWGGETVLYHALPYGLHDGMRRLVRAGQFANVEKVLAAKREMLACHRTQKEWLDASQGLDAYLNTMEEMCKAVGRMSGRFRYAEGWRRHSHLGFAADPSADPLSALLGEACWTAPKYERALG
jgi:LmbE family N-acetylglucosaminyl deacetylase